MQISWRIEQESLFKYATRVGNTAPAVGFWIPENRVVAQGVQEECFWDPFLLNDDSKHDRDLPRPS